MDSENIFAGFDIPASNYSKLPHSIIENLDRFRTLGELKVVLYILRHTWGYQEFGEAKLISMDEFVNGRKNADETRMDRGLGMSEPSIRQGIEYALEDGFLIQFVDEADKARIKNYYALRMSSNSEVKKLYPRGKDSFSLTERNFTSIRERNSRKKLKKYSFSGESEIFLHASKFITPYGTGMKRLHHEKLKAAYKRVIKAGNGETNFNGAMNSLFSAMARYADWQQRGLSVAEMEAELAQDRKQAIAGDVAKSTRAVQVNTERDEMTQAVIAGWKVPESFARKIAKFLQGLFTASGDKKLDKRDEQWIEHNLTTPITAADVLPFVAWYEKTNTKKDGTPINLPDNAQDIAKWVTRWVMLGKPNPIETPQQNKQSALSGVKLINKGAAA